MRALLLSLALSACYDPGAVNCTVSCSGNGECAAGQVCGGDGFCAAPDVAGHCSSVDGGAGGPAVALKVMIMGKGKVEVQNAGYCDSEEEQSGVPRGSARSWCRWASRASSSPSRTTTRNFSSGRSPASARRRPAWSRPH